MNPQTRQYPSKFVLSIANIESELMALTEATMQQMGRNKDDEPFRDQLIRAWVVHQLQRELYLTFDRDRTYNDAQAMFFEAPPSYFNTHRYLIDQFVGQVRPVLSVGPDIPYNERICTAEFWLPNLTLKFL
jgi:hypothetical protein